MGKRKENDNTDDINEVEIIGIVKKGRMSSVAAAKSAEVSAGPSSEIRENRKVKLKTSGSISANELHLGDPVDERWEERDAALARALQEEFNRPYQSLSYQQSAMQLQEIGITDPEELGQLVGSGIFSHANFEDDNLDLSYEALLELGERIGDAKPKGLPKHIINRLVQKTFSFNRSFNVDDRQCVVCLNDYQEEDLLIGLPCCHLYDSILILVFTAIALELG